MSNLDKQVKVILLREDTEILEDLVFRQTATNHFLKGYSDSDSVYDRNE